MPTGRKGMMRFVGGAKGALQKPLKSVVAKSAASLAKEIDKDDFLEQLKDAWTPLVKKHTPIEDELVAAQERIDKSPYKKAFEVANITSEDIRELLEEIRDEKIDPVRLEHAKVGRNQPCPCGSGKKYKFCCGK